MSTALTHIYNHFHAGLILTRPCLLHGCHEINPKAFDVCSQLHVIVQSIICSSSTLCFHVKELKGNVDNTDILKPAPSWSNVALKSGASGSMLATPPASQQQQQIVASSSSSSGGGGSVFSPSGVGPGASSSISNSQSRPSVGALSNSSSSSSQKQQQKQAKEE